MKTPLLFLVVLLYNSISIAQTPGNLSQQVDWIAQPNSANRQMELSWLKGVTSRYTNGDGIQSQLMSDGTRVFISRTGKKDFGVAAVKSDFSHKWLTALEGTPIAFGRFKDKIVIATLKGRKDLRYEPSECTMYLLETKRGKVEVTKKFINEQMPFIVDPYFYFSEDGEIFQMGFRETTISTTKKGSPFRIIGEYVHSTSWNQITYNEKLEEVSRTKIEFPTKGVHMHSVINNKGDLYICSQTGTGMLELYRFNKNSESASQTTPIYIDNNKKKVDFLELRLDKYDDNYAYVIPVYEDADKVMSIEVVRVNTTGEEKLNKRFLITKDWANEVAKNFKNPGTHKMKPGVIGLRDVRYCDFIQEGDNLLLMLSSIYSRTVTNNQRQNWGSDVLIVNLNSSTLKVNYSNLIPRDVPETSRGSGLSAFAFTDNKFIHVITNEQRSRSTRHSIYSRLDLKTGEFLKLEQLAQQKENYSRVMEPAFTFREDRKFFLIYSEEGSKPNMVIQEFRIDN